VKLKLLKPVRPTEYFNLVRPALRVSLSSRARAAIEQEAAARQQLPHVLAARILEAVFEGKGIVDAVLDDGAGATGRPTV
jgi:hypothetical protein